MMTITTTSYADVLDRLDEGEISVDDAVRLLQELENQRIRVEQPELHSGSAELQRWDFWWLLPISLGILLTLFGGWLAWLGGLWWILAAPVLAFGIFSMTLGLLHNVLPWAHVRVHTGTTSWPQRIVISVPFPVGFGAWILEGFGHWIPSMDRATVGQLASLLRNLDLKTTPITIFVDEAPSSERVEIYIG